MGMLFNTPATLRTLEMLNAAFHRAGLNYIRANGVWAANFQSNGGLPGTNGTHKGIAAPMGLDHDDQGLSNKWSTWLTNVFDRNANPDGTIIAKFVGDAINDGINDTNNCVRIEFFAVPDSKIFAEKIKMTTTGSKYSLVINVHTTTMDNS